MYIYNKPHAHHARREAAAPAGDMSSLGHDHPHPQPQHHPHPHPHPHHPPPARPPPPPSSSASQPQAPLSHRPAKDAGRSALPFSLPPFFFGPGNASSTSLVPSTAEGRPIPLGDDTAAHRTSALRELNNNYPSPVLRHRYAKSTSAKNSTYSHPVIVRTYGGPPPAHSSGTKPHGPGGHHRHPSAGRPFARRIPLSTSSEPAHPLGFSPAAKLGGVGISTIGKHAHGGILTMGRHAAKKPSRWQWVPGLGGGRDSEEPKLPPLEAFSFKSFMADVPENDDLPAALDRIAEICARSRFSLSSQYEVHVPPYGPGAIMVPNGQSGGRRRSGRHRRETGPTLRAVQSDDDENSARVRRRRPPRRASAAQGTLETIMSSHSSQSSKEEKKKKKKKSAAEIVDEVRGRATGSAARGIAEEGGAAAESAEAGRKVARRKSTSFAHAVMDSSWHPTGADAVSPRNSAAALVGSPALPQASSSHLEIRTAPEAAYQDVYRHEAQPASPAGSGAESPLSQELPLVGDTGTTNPGLLSGFNTWMPWNGAGPNLPSGPRSAGQRSQAAGSLRDLLKTVDGKQKKGKEVDRGT